MNFLKLNSIVAPVYLSVAGLSCATGSNSRRFSHGSRKFIVAGVVNSEEAVGLLAVGYFSNSALTL